MNFDTVILHCSATNSEQDFDAATIDRWHKANGWKGCGYHFVIKRDGTVERGRDITERGAHAKGYNDTIGVCYIGGCDLSGRPEDNMTVQQVTAFKQLVNKLRDIFGEVRVIGHNDLPGVRKACPSFKVSDKFGSWCNG